MGLSKQQVSHLIKIMEAVHAILAEAQRASLVAKASRPSQGKRTRRTRREAESLKKAVTRERKAGVPVSELSEKYGVTPSYIYQLRD